MNQEEPNVNNQETALKILIQACNLAQSRGAYSLSEAGLLDKCIKMFTRKPEEALTQPDTVITDDDTELEIENIAI